MSKADSTKATLTAFPPIVGPDARILILGSMPGIASLQADQYYAHPRNAFWRIMAIVYNTELRCWADKIALLKQQKLALWDVLKECHRPGSLDANIQTDSMVCNDFATFLSDYPSVERIVFNGKVAEKTFLKQVVPTLGERQLQLQVMPSTSPAMASLTAEQKTELWRPALLLKQTG